MPTSKETQPLPYRLSAFVYPLTAASLAECLRRHAGLFAEKSGEVRGIGKSQIIGNLVDRLSGKHELALGFREHALADQMSSRHAGRALDVIIEPVSGHRQFPGVETDQPLFSEILVE